MKSLRLSFALFRFEMFWNAYIFIPSVVILFIALNVRI